MLRSRPAPMNERGGAVTMRMRILTPIEVVIDERVLKIVAVATNGAFGILPRHIDFVAPLPPGVLTYMTEEGKECFVGLDEGTLLKRGKEVRISCLNAICGRDLESLQHHVRQQFHLREEQERTARSALARLEANVVRRFIELERRG
jgi:F-type H+-transporting ATPase subunit epsilon